MKISTNYFFDDYNNELVNRKDICNKEIESYINSREYLLSKLEIFKPYIKGFTNIDVENVHKLKRRISERSLVYSAHLAGEINIEQIRRIINMIVEINLQINVLKDNIVEIEKDIIDFEIFKSIVYKFNNKISDIVLYKGYVFHLGLGLGHVRIRKINCKFNRNGTPKVKKKIDWNASNKKKEEILSRGGVPYRVTERDTTGKILADNGGEKWFVYFTYEWDYLWHWSRGRKTVLNSAYFRFRPTIYNNTSREGKKGNMNKLKEMVRTDSPLLANFFERNSDWNGNQHTKVA